MTGEFMPEAATAGRLSFRVLQSGCEKRGRVRLSDLWPSRYRTRKGL